MSTGVVKLAMARADVASLGEQLAKGVQVTVQGTEAVLADAKGTVLRRAEVAEIRRNSRKSSTLVLVDGTEWVLTSGGCGCGGR